MEKIKELRLNGLSYGKIAKKLDISINTVKSYCRRNNLTGNIGNNIDGFCKECKKPIQKTNSKKRKFCSDECRQRWWNKNIDKVNKKANYELVCNYCKNIFISYGNKNRKYCSHECYIRGRFGA